MNKTNLIHAIALSLISFFVIFCYFEYLNKLNVALQQDFKVPFVNNTSAELSSGPIWFFYDKDCGVISSTKPISQEDKFTLLSLYPSDQLVTSSYKSAVDKLAYISNKDTNEIFSLILILGSLGGVLGVMIRSLSSLIYHSCFQKDLDMKLWWPWYYLRPIMGLGLGITIVILSKTKLLNIDSPGELTGFWILGVCILAGFAVSEVTDRLFYAAKALFGGQDLSETRKNQAQNKDN